MSFTPQPGLVICVEHRWPDWTTNPKGTKFRPCVVMSVTPQEDGSSRVIGTTITHTPPDPKKVGYPIGPKTRERLGLDDDEQWAKVNGALTFTWGKLPIGTASKGRPYYGALKAKNFKIIQDKLAEFLSPNVTMTSLP